MKTMLFALVIQAGLYAQTAIVGPLYDAAGALATCQLSITPQSVPGFSASTIRYVILAGDLSGTTGGYGTGITSISRHAALQLYPGIYDPVIMSCAGESEPQFYTWTVAAAGSSVTIQSLLGLTITGPTLGTLTGTLGTLSGTLGTLGQ